MKPRLTPPAVIPASLEPLRISDSPRLTEDELEGEFKAAMIEVFEAMLRPGLLRLNSYGVPHRGAFPTVERFVKADGLAMERKTAAEAFMAELYRAWRARNPRRGTAFLRYYLQLLWPGQWTLVQQWQDAAMPYPGGLHDTYAPGRFLTSRLRLTLALADDDSGELVGKLSGSFRAVLPARMLLDVALTAPLASQSMRAANWSDDCEWEDFEGAAAIYVAPTATLTLTAPSPATGLVGVAAGGGTVSNGGTVSQNFTLSADLGASVSPSSGALGGGDSVGYTITAVAAGLHAITLANTSGGSVAGSPAGFTATAAGDAHWNNVVLMLPFDGADGGTTFVDASLSARTPSSVSNVTTSTAGPKFGPASGRTVTSNGVLEYPFSADFSYAGTGVFTIEFWLWIDAANDSQRYFLGNRQSGGRSFRCDLSSGAYNLRFRGTGITELSLGNATPHSTWTHIAVSCDGTTMRGFRNGLLTNESASSNFPDTSVGAFSVFSASHLWETLGFIGRIDDLRFTRGIARYTGNFTIPTEAFPNSL
jgi:hypothetical protein